MQDKTIQFQRGTQLISSGMADIINVLKDSSEQVSNIKDQVNAWLDGQSKFAMCFAQLTMTRRAVILLHFAMVAQLLAILLAETNIVATFILCAITFVLVSKFNKCVQKDEKGNLK